MLGTPKKDLEQDRKRIVPLKHNRHQGFGPRAFTLTLRAGHEVMFLGKNHHKATAEKQTTLTSDQTPMLTSQFLRSWWCTCWKVTISRTAGVLREELQAFQDDYTSEDKWHCISCCWTAGNFRLTAGNERAHQGHKWFPTFFLSHVAWGKPEPAQNLCSGPHHVASWSNLQWIHVNNDREENPNCIWQTAQLRCL